MLIKIMILIFIMLLIKNIKPDIFLKKKKKCILRISTKILRGIRASKKLRTRI